MSKPLKDVCESYKAVPQIISVAVCIYEDVTVIDYQGIVDFLGGVSFAAEILPSPPKCLFDVQYLSKTLEPVKPFLSGPRIVPDTTYQAVLDAGKHYDVILVPAGSPLHPYQEKEAIEFLAKEAPLARYVLAMCTGSGLFAATGLLDGKKATTNKMSFKHIEQEFPKVNWIRKARWVVDGNIWTSSGLSASFDMGHAFVAEVVGKDIAKFVASSHLEYRPSTDPDQDEFAVLHGLV